MSLATEQRHSDQLADLFEQAPSIMALLRGPDHVFEFANEQYLQLTGHRDLIGKSMREALPEIEGQGFIDLLDRVYATGERHVGMAAKVSLKRNADGPPDEVIVDFIYQPVADASGQITGIFVQATDVTERTRAEQLNALQNRVLELALEDVSLEDALNELVRVVEAHSSSGMVGSVLLISEDGTHLRHGAAPGLPPAYNEAIDGIEIGPAVGSCGTAAHTKAPVHASDIASDPLWVDFRELALSNGLRACWSTPILSRRGRVLGTFAMYYHEPRACPPADLELVDFVARSAALVIERKQAETALRESEQRYRGLVGASNQVLYRHSPDWSEMRQLHGGGFLADTTEPDQDWFDKYIHPEDQPQVRAAIQDAIHSKTPFEFEHRVIRDDGSLGWTHSRSIPLLDRHGEIVEWFGAASDITEQRQMEESLRVKATEFEALAENVSQLAWMAEPNGSVFWYNKRWYEYTGTDLESMRDWGWRDIHHPDHIERVIEEVRHRWEAGEAWEGTYLLRSAEGEYRWFLTRAEPIRDDAGNLVRWFGTNTDITEQLAAEQQLIEQQRELTVLNETLESRVVEEVERRNQVEEALRQSQKMETVGQLTGGIAHDFNNLLQIISGNLDMVRRKLPEGSVPLRRSLDNAFRGAERAALLTQRLLAFSRRQPLSPTVIDANKLVSAISELIHRMLGETVEVETVLSSGLWRIEADANQLENAILNLAVNSRDAMPDGGKLTIETANTHIDHAYGAHHAVEPGQYVVICVSDAGSGMDAGTVERAFEPFFTTKEVGQGTGLGLSMVYGFVKQSGGHVKIYSEPGDGTTVKLYLPRYRGAQTASDEAASVRAPGGTKSETILVCEDDVDVRAFSVETLRELGYRVCEAKDGSEALELLIAEAGMVDLLFTDIVLPGGLTGAELANQAKQIQPGLRVLFTTGYARNAIGHQGRLDQDVELLPKPFTFSDLAARIRDLLDK